MILTKRQCESLDFENVAGWTTEENERIEVYKRDDIEITFSGKHCISIELNEFPILGVKSIQALEKFIKLVYHD